MDNFNLNNEKEVIDAMSYCPHCGAKMDGGKENG